jgi:hypothetical protein
MSMDAYLVNGGINAGLDVIPNGIGRIVNVTYLIVLCVCGLIIWKKINYEVRFLYI